jgi:hypothetical protein
VSSLLEESLFLSVTDEGGGVVFVPMTGSDTKTGASGDE